MQKRPREVKVFPFEDLSSQEIKGENHNTFEKILERTHAKVCMQSQISCVETKPYINW